MKAGLIILLAVVVATSSVHAAPKPAPQFRTKGHNSVNRLYYALEKYLRRVALKSPVKKSKIAGITDGDLWQFASNQFAFVPVREPNEVIYFREQMTLLPEKPTVLYLGMHAGVDQLGAMVGPGHAAANGVLRAPQIVDLLREHGVDFSVYEAIFITGCYAGSRATPNGRSLTDDIADLTKIPAVAPVGAFTTRRVVGANFETSSLDGMFSIDVTDFKAEEQHGDHWRISLPSQWIEPHDEKVARRIAMAEELGKRYSAYERNGTQLTYSIALNAQGTLVRNVAGQEQTVGPLDARFARCRTAILEEWDAYKKRKAARRKKP